jgi:hypothetical protein
MNNGLEPALTDDAVEGRLVSDVGFVELGDRTGDLTHPIENRAFRIDEIVDDHHIVAGLEQLDDGVTPDEAGSPGDQNSHGRQDTAWASTRYRAGI